MARRERTPSQRQYPRTARLNELVREIVADELEKIDDERLELVTVTRRGARSTSSPARASSCNRRPPTFTADTIGGTCSISPVSVAAAAATSAGETAMS